LFYKMNIHKFNRFSPTDNFRMIYYAIYYMFRPSEAKHMRKSSKLAPDMGVIERIASAAETTIANIFFRLTLNYIKVNHQRYINIQDDKDNHLYDKYEVRVPEEKFTKLRILSTKPLKYNLNEKSTIQTVIDRGFDFLGLNFKTIEDIPEKNLIIHIHGGGFFATSTESHLGYLINFSNALDSVVISIDYTVAPKSKYPAIFNENYQAYKKIVQQSEKLFGFRINKLVLTGDSCGGHFCLDVMRNCIKDGIRKPDGCLLIYPSTRIVFDNMGPSFGMTCRDSVIEISLMGNMQRAVLDLEKLSIEHYEKDNTFNFYKTHGNIIAQFPKTYIIVASHDPMKDESFILADFLLRHNVNVKIKEFLYYFHGFINMAGSFPFLKRGEDECIECMKEIFK